MGLVRPTHETGVRSEKWNSWFVSYFFQQLTRHTDQHKSQRDADNEKADTKMQYNGVHASISYQIHAAINNARRAGSL
jgi:hypothetical protein